MERGAGQQCRLDGKRRAARQRSPGHAGAGEARRIARLSSPGLWQPSSGVPATILIPDELDLQRGFYRFYGMSVKEYAGIHWGFLWPFKLNTDIVTELAWSRDGWNWQRLP